MWPVLATFKNNGKRRDSVVVLHLLHVASFSHKEKPMGRGVLVVYFLHVASFGHI
jgi:hypothetical protein